MIRVVHFLDGKHFGGAEEAVARLARSHDPERVVAEVACLSEGRLTQRLSAQGTNYTLLRRPTIAGWRVAGDLAFLARERRFDIIHSHASRANLIGRLTALRGRIAHVATIHSPIDQDINDASHSRRLQVTVDRAGRFLSKRIIFVSDEERQRQIQQGLPESKAAFIPNGVERKPPPKRLRLAELRERWALGEGRAIAVMIAQLRPRKGPETLISAMAETRAAVPNSLAVFVGDAEFVESRDYLAELKDLAAREGVESHVKFVGFCDDVPAALALAHVSVLPSRFGEGLPLTLLESMAAGLPIVTTDIPGNREAVRHEENGVLVPPDDPHALAQALIRLFSDTVLRERLGAEGRRLAEEIYDMRLVATRHEELYEEILGRTPKPAEAPAPPPPPDAPPPPPPDAPPLPPQLEEEAAAEP
ncbi:MAG: glycosyltransferase family 4 protein [Candidatus Sumerlaeota bacterium]|nr:glycosyltransferase family 4 protein [Candidatus Sumerlaeota bacterium]